MQQERSVYFFFASRNSILNWKHGSRSRQCLSSLWKETKKAKKEKRVMTYACSSHQQGLERAFSINVEKDTPDVQPTSFCLACYMVMQRSDKAATKGTPYEHSVEVYEWIPHDAEEPE